MHFPLPHSFYVNLNYPQFSDLTIVMNRIKIDIQRAKNWWRYLRVCRFLGRRHPHVDLSAAPVELQISNCIIDRSINRFYYLQLFFSSSWPSFNRKHESPFCFVLTCESHARIQSVIWESVVCTSERKGLLFSREYTHTCTQANGRLKYRVRMLWNNHSFSDLHRRRS